MVSININSPTEVAEGIARRARARRLQLNLSQKTLSERSGVSYGTLKKFERTGQIALQALLKIALVLDELTIFEGLFTNKHDELPASLDELLRQPDASPTRKRGRQ